MVLLPGVLPCRPPQKARLPRKVGAVMANEQVNAQLDTLQPA
jgi:hypothetical protein